MAACGSSAKTSAPANKSAGQQITTIRIALNNTTDSLAAVVAEQQGFFADHSLKVESTTLSNITVIPGLLGNQYDIGITVAPIIINAASAGLGVELIAGNDGDSPTNHPVEVFVRKGITSVKQLAGKRIGTPTITGNINIATKAWLAANGVNPSSNQFVQVPTPNMVDELEAGQVDAVELLYPFINVAKADGLTSLGDPERALTTGYLGGTYWAASKSWITTHQAAVSNFRAALDQADTWIANNQLQAYKAASAYTGVPLAQAEQSPLGQYTTAVSASDLQIWENAMKKFGGFQGNVSPSSLVANDI